MGKLVIIFLLCTSKFLLGIGMAAASDLTWIEGILISGIGGVTGIVFYLFSFEWIIGLINKRTKDVKVKFNKWRRFMISIKQKGGLLGIAILTPMILSIPVGIALSISLGSSKKRILVFHITSIIIWTLLVFGVKYGLGYNVTETFKQ